MKYSELNNLILDTFREIPTVNSVTNNSLDWNVHKDIEYPAIAADLQNVTVEDGIARYNYIFTGAMIGLESETDRVRNYTNMMEVLYQGLEFLADEDDVEMEGNMVFNFGSLKYMDVLDCATCQLTLVTPMDVDCEFQADFDE